MINASRFAELKIFRETVWTVAKITRADRSVDPEYSQKNSSNFGCEKKMGNLYQSERAYMESFISQVSSADYVASRLDKNRVGLRRRQQELGSSTVCQGKTVHWSPVQPHGMLRC